MNATLLIDDSLPSAPGNWVEVPQEYVAAWQSLTLDERRDVLAGRGRSALVAALRSTAVSEVDEHGT